MSVTGWLLFILLVQAIHFVGTWKLYVKAGRHAWEAAIPVYNAIILMKIINRPTWWTLLLFVPIINLFMFPIVWIETLRTFGKKSTLDMFLGVFTLGFYIMYVNYTQEVTYFENRDTKAPNKALETLGSLSFAIIVATLVHTYVIQPFIIPTSSLEKSLLIGDFLFVSKYHYGARTPKTAIAAPMVHDTLPIIKTKSYLEKPQIPTFRFPGFTEIKRNDIVVFNWPTDTLFNMYIAADKRYDKPIDKRTNYVKRCVAIPGDVFEIRDGNIFINGKESIMPDRAKPQFHYYIKTKNSSIHEIIANYNLTENYPFFKISNAIWDKAELKNYLIENNYFEEIERDSLTSTIRGNVNEEIIKKLNLEQSNTFFVGNLTTEIADKMKSDSKVLSVERVISNDPEDGIFPDQRDGKTSTSNNWSKDNFGPITIPKEGATVTLNAQTIPFYKAIIREYEGHDLKVNGDQITIDGKVANSYTFEQDYFWMMGDNRHNSLDARYWGFTPEDHIVGKPIFIWMSIDGINGPKSEWKIRWDRVFTIVDGTGEPKSYFVIFLIGLGVYFVGEYFWKKRKKNKLEA